MLFALMFTLAFAMFKLTLPLMAGIYIVSDLGGSAYLSPYGVSFFCIGTVLGVPLGNASITRLSAIQIYVVCLACMGILTCGCAASTNYLSFIVFRFLDGLATGPLFMVIPNTLIPFVIAQNKQPISRQMSHASITPAIYSKFFDYRRFTGEGFRQELNNKHFILAIILTCFSSAPMIGACWGDWIAFYYHWRILFIVNAPICLFLIFYVGHGLRESHQPSDPAVRFDKTGYLYFFIGMLFIGSALIVGQEFDWFRSYWLSFFIISGAISCILFFVHCLSATEPIVDFRLFKNTYFFLGILTLGILFSIYFGFVILLSLWLKLYVNYTADWIVLLTCLLILGAWIPLFLHYQKYDPRFPLVLALILLIASCFYSSYFNVDINFGRIALTRVPAGLAIPIFLPPLFRLTVYCCPREKQTESIAVFHMARLLGAGLGAGLFITLWQRRQVFYNQRLGSRLTEFSEITQQFFVRAQQFHLTEKQTVAQLQVFLDRQATALALDDCFYFMGWLILILLASWATTFFLRSHQPIEVITP